MPHHDSDDEDWYDDESADLDADDTVPCPECGTAIYADLDHCPKCGHWLTDDDHRTLDRGAGLFSSRRVRIVAIILIALFTLGLLADLVGTF